MFFSSCLARRRHWQWYVLAGFAGYDTPRAVFPSIVDVRGDSTSAVLGQVVALADEARGDSTGAVLGQVVLAPVVMLRQVLGVGQCRKTVEVLQLQSVQFLEVVVLVTTGAFVGPDSAEFVEILQFWTRLLVCSWCAETVEAPQLQFIDSLVHVPAVMQRLVPMVQTVQLGVEAWAAHFLDDELWVFFRVPWGVSTGTRSP